MIKENSIIHFVSKEIPESLSKDMIDQGFSVSCISSGKGFFPVYKELYINDLHDQRFYADLLINNAPVIKPEHHYAQTLKSFLSVLRYHRENS